MAAVIAVSIIFGALPLGIVCAVLVYRYKMAQLKVTRGATARLVAEVQDTRRQLEARIEVLESIALAHDNELGAGARGALPEAKLVCKS